MPGKSLIDLKTDLKSLRYGSSKPLVTKDINNPPQLNGLSMEVTHRTDDLVRITKLLASKNGFKWAAHEALLQQAAKGPGERQGDTLGQAVVNTLLNTGVDVLKIAGSTLAQVPVNGTGTHFIRGFNPRTYLHQSGGFSSLYAAKHALKGDQIITPNRSDTWSPQADTVFPTANIFEQDNNLKSTKKSFLNSLISSIFNFGGENSKLSTPDALPPDTDKYIGDTYKPEVKKPTSAETEKTILNPDGNPNSISPASDLKNKQPTQEIYYKTDAQKDNEAPQEKKKVNEVNPDTSYANQKGALHFKWGNKGRIRTKDDTEPRPDELQQLGVLTEELAETKEDIIPFEFNIITPRDIKGKYLYFRAFLDNFSDSYNGDWQGSTYIGRAEQFYTYQGFKREISFAFKLAAFSQLELKPLYRKLNHLVGSTGPTYGRTDFMKGTLVRVTVGDYLEKQVGIINSVDVSWDKDYPWEIDGEIGRLPHIMSIDISFTPIHDFNVEANLNKYIGANIL